MKYFFLVIFLAAALCCKDIKSNQEKYVYPSTDSKVNAILSDTICFKDVLTDTIKHLRILSACYVMLNDSASFKKAYEYSQGRLSLFLNFDIEGNILAYTRQGDTVSVKIMYMVEKRNSMVKPQFFNLLDDTLNITLKKTLIKQTQNPEGYKFDILELTFMILNLDKQLVIKKLNS